MASDLDFIISNEKALQQIVSRLNDWHDNMAPFFEENEEYANSYRLIESTKRASNQFTKTKVGETIRATEALTTSMFRMMTSHDPNYDLISMDGSQTPEQLYAAHLQLRYQDYALKWKRHLLRALRSLTLFGTQFVETPWIRVERFGRLQYEGLGFVPRSLLQCAFDTRVMDANLTPWCAFIDYMTEDQLLDKADEDQEHWNPIQIQKAIDQFKVHSSQISDRISARRQKAGYKDVDDVFEVVTYYGRIRDIPREDKRHWVIRFINEQIPISGFGNPSPTGNLPMQAATYLDFEMEPLGHGVGRLGKIAQRHMDANRIRYLDVATAATYLMWLKSRMSGIANTDIKFKPLGIITGDDITEAGLRPLRPELSSIDVGLKMEEIFKAEHQGNTGATPNLQAEVTDVSATEAGIAQNEALRRVAVTAENIGELFIRDYQIEKHKYNIEWLETDMTMAMEGMEQPLRVNRMNMARNVGLFIKMVTDKDFRPKRLQNMLQAYQLINSIRGRQNLLVDDTEVIKEIFRALDMDPRRIIRDENNVPAQNYLNFMMQAKQTANNQAQELGAESAAKLDEAGAPQMNLADSPVGPVALTP